MKFIYLVYLMSILVKLRTLCNIKACLNTLCIKKMEHEGKTKLDTRKHEIKVHGGTVEYSYKIQTENVETELRETRSEIKYA